MVGKAILFLIMYIIIPPGIFALGKLAKEQAKYALFGRRRSATAIKAQAQKEGLNKKIVKRLNFTMKDPRNAPMPFRLVFLLIYALGGIVALYGGFVVNWKVLLAAVIIAYISVIFSCATANKIVVERDQVLGRMLELKGSKMRLMNRDKGSIATPDSEFKVLKWSEDLVHPEKMHLFMPTDFDILEIDGFLESFNLIFGSNGQWVSDDSDKDYGGFDFNAGVAAIRISPKLPQMAMWHERYLNPKDIHWSYFPLALGSENGVPVYNDELGITENVLGFAVNGGQEKLSKKNGVNIGPEVTSSPQILIAGGTGGGKSLCTHTPIEVVIEE